MRLRFRCPLFVASESSSQTVTPDASPYNGSRVEYYDTRDDFNKSEIAKSVDQAGAIWALWHTGAQTNARGDYAKWNITRLLLADKDCEPFFTDFWKFVTNNEPQVQLQKESVSSLTSRVEAELSQKGRQANEGVKWYRAAPTMLITIVNPDKLDGWALVQLLVPYERDAGKRPCLVATSESSEAV